MAPAHNTAGGPHRAFRRFPYNQRGLRGRRMRLLTDLPTDDASVPQDLPRGTIDVISTEDEVGPNLSVRVHPVDDTTQIAYVVIDQLALYE